MVVGFINTILFAINTEAALAVIGLSKVQIPTLGSIIFWALNYNALMIGQTAWIIAPIVATVLLFLGLFLTSTGYNELFADQARCRMIKLDNIVATYTTQRGQVNAVDGVTLELPDSMILGIAGELGCGKSTLMKVIYGDIGFPLELASGSVDYGFQNDRGQPVTSQNIQQEWFKRISYIPQSSMSSLNPVVRIREQFIDFPATSKKRLQSLEQVRAIRAETGAAADRSTPIRTSFPAACASASWSRWRPSSSRTSSWPMSRRRRWMWWCKRAF